MAQFALIKDGVVLEVIEATPEWARDDGPRHMQNKFGADAANITVRRVCTDDENEDEKATALVTRDAEPGAVLTERASTAQERAAFDAIRSARQSGDTRPLRQIARSLGIDPDLARRAMSTRTRALVRFFTRASG